METRDPRSISIRLTTNFTLQILVFIIFFRGSARVVFLVILGERWFGQRKYIDIKSQIYGAWILVFPTASGSPGGYNPSRAQWVSAMGTRTWSEVERVSEREHGAPVKIIHGVAERSGDHHASSPRPTWRPSRRFVWSVCRKEPRKEIT